MNTPTLDAIIAELSFLRAQVSPDKFLLGEILRLKNEMASMRNDAAFAQRTLLAIQLIVKQDPKQTLSELEAWVRAHWKN